jgi:hypothetical protein
MEDADRKTTHPMTIPAELLELQYFLNLNLLSHRMSLVSKEKLLKLPVKLNPLPFGEARRGFCLEYTSILN